MRNALLLLGASLLLACNGGSSPSDAGAEQNADSGAHQDGGPNTVSDISFSCNDPNIGAFVDSNPAMEIGCPVTTSDPRGNALSGVPVSFLAEAGALQFDTTYGTYAYFPFRSGPGNVAGNKPLQVIPTDCEPSYTDASGETHNPRDGTVTLVAYAPRSADSNNGPQGEPYVDVDDSGSYHLGDPFADLNGNGVWDSSQTSVIWAQTKVLWSGQLQTMSPISVFEPTFDGTDVTSGVTLRYGATGTFVWYLLDENLNTLAANHPATDAITWNCSPEPNVTPLSNTAKLISMTDFFGLDCWFIETPVSLAVENESPCEEGATAVPFTCYGTVSRTLWTYPDGTPGDTVSGEMTQVVTGTAEPDPPTCLSGG